MPEGDDRALSVTADTVSRRVLGHGADVSFIHIAAGSATSTIAVYDGNDTNGRLVARLKVASTGSHTLAPKRLMRFHTGIHVEIEANTPTWTIGFIPVPD